MAVQDYKINYKSDFVLTINGDAGWAVPFCIKFWTGMPSQAYFVGFDGVKYVNCRVGDTPTQLLVMFDDHHLPIGPLRMQIAYHTTIEEFPGSVFDEVTNARDVIVTIDGTDYQVLLDFTGEDAPELEFDLPAYANEAERIQNELQRQQNEADRIAAELQREQATSAAVEGAENVNAQLAGNILTVTNRQGVSRSVNTKGEQGEQGPVGPEGPQGEQGISIVDFSPKSQTTTTLIYTATFSDGHTQDVSIPKGPKGDTGATGPTGPQGPQGQTGVSITGLVKTGETETDTLYNVTFSNGTTQAVSIPKGEKGDQGPAGPTGPQGPMGDVAVITPEQQSAFTMYSTTGQNTNGPMTQKAVTDALVAGSISYDNSQSGLAATDVQGALDEVSNVIINENEIFSTIPVAKVIGGSNTWVTSSGMNGEFVPVVHGKKYRIVVDSSNSGVIAFMTIATTTNVYYAGGATSRTVLPPSTNVVLTAPSDANYLYFTQIGSTPVTVQVYEIDTIQDDIDNINDDINTIENTIGLKNSVINFVDFNYFINANQLLQQTSSSWRMSTSMYKVGDDFTIVPTDQTQQYYPVGFDENFHFIRSYADDGMATGTRTFNASSFGIKYIYVAASNRNSMSIDAQAIFKRESIVCAASDTSCKDGADIICPSTDARESLQLAISYGLLTDRKVILMNGRYILNSYIAEGGGNACLVASGFTTSTGETDDQYGNRIRFTTIEGSNDVLGWADGAILKVSDTLYESVTDAAPLTVIRGMVTDWQPWEKASAISLKNIKVILPSNQKAITCVDFGYTDNARVEHLYCSAFDPLVTPLNVHPDDLDIPIANSECVGVKLTFGANFDASIFEHISVLGFYIGIDFSGDHVVVNSPTAIYCYYGFTFGKFLRSGSMNQPTTIINMTDEHNVCLPIYYAYENNTKTIQILSGNVFWPEKGCQGNIPFDDPRRVAATIPNHNYNGFINYVNGIDTSTGWFSTIQSSLPTSYFAAGSEIYMEQKNMAAPPSATSAVRRTWAKGLGMQCFDTTLNKVVFCVVKNNALAWVDANGTNVDS